MDCQREEERRLQIPGLGPPQVLDCTAASETSRSIQHVKLWRDIQRVGNENMLLDECSVFLQICSAPVQSGHSLVVIESYLLPLSGFKPLCLCERASVYSLQYNSVLHQVTSHICQHVSIAICSYGLLQNGQGAFSILASAAHSNMLFYAVCGWFCACVVITAVESQQQLLFFNQLCPLLQGL